MIIILLVSCTSFSRKGSEVKDAIGEITRSATNTKTLKGTPTADIMENRFIEFSQGEWKLLFDKEPIVKVVVRSERSFWLLSAEGMLLSSLDQGEWVTFEKNDYAIPDLPNDMVLANDDSIWIAGRKSIAHFENGHWRVYAIPNVTDTSFTRIATDPSNNVWIATPLCNCENSIKKFDGVEWTEFSPKQKIIGTNQILFDLQGNLWASFGWPEGIGRYDGETWKFFSGMDLWPSGSFQPIGITCGQDGVIWAVLENQESIITIDDSGLISEVNFPAGLKIDSHLLRTYVDKKNRFWINAFHIDSSGVMINGTGLAFFDGSTWNTFSGLPFTRANDIAEDDAGNIYISTEKGVYKYN
jgi:ligand-binding sensor domain-containing protein